MSKDEERIKITKVKDFTEEYSKLHNTTAELVISIIDAAARAWGDRILKLTENNLNEAVIAYERVYVDIVTTILDYLRTSKHAYALDIIESKKIEVPKEYLDLVREAAGLKNSDKSKGCRGVGKFGYIL